MKVTAQKYKFSLSEQLYFVMIFGCKSTHADHMTLIGVRWSFHWQRIWGDADWGSVHLIKSQCPRVVETCKSVILTKAMWAVLVQATSHSGTIVVQLMSRSHTNRNIVCFQSVRNRLEDICWCTFATCLLYYHGNVLPYWLFLLLGPLLKILVECHTLEIYYLLSIMHYLNLRF